jgi:hypothetical protein
MQYEGYSDYVGVSPALLRLLRGIVGKTKKCNLRKVLRLIDEGRLDHELLSACRIDAENVLPQLRHEVYELVSMYGPDCQGPFSSTLENLS